MTGNSDISKVSLNSSWKNSGISAASLRSVGIIVPHEESKSSELTIKIDGKKKKHKKMINMLGDKLAQRNEMEDLFGDVIDYVEPVRTFKEPSVSIIPDNRDNRAPRDKKIEMMANNAIQSGVSEVTKKGNILSNKELVGIQKSRVKKRQEKKKEKMKIFNEKDKSRTVLRKRQASKKGHDTFYPMSLEEKKVEEPIQIVSKQKKINTVKVNNLGFTKKERQDFRAFKIRQKNYKKSKKKERQGKIIAESDDLFIEEELEFEDYFRKYSRQGTNLLQSLRNMGVDIDALLRRHSNNIIEVVKAIAFVVSLYKSQDRISDCSALTAYILSMDIKDADAAFIVSFGIGALAGVRSMVRDFNAQAGEDVFTEAFSDDLRDLGSMGSQLMSSVLVNAARKIIMVAVSFKLVGKSDAEQLSKFFGDVHRPMTVVSAIEYIINAVADVIKVCEALNDGVPLCQALFYQDPLKQAISNAKDWLRYSDMLYYGIAEENKRCAREFVIKTKDSKKLIDHALSKMNSFSAKYDIYADISARLNIAIDNVENRLLRTARPAPAAVIVHGLPGVGKSTVVDFIYRVYSDIKNRKFDYTQVYEKVSTSDYWDGYSPIGTPIIHYSEPGCLAENIVKNMGDRAVLELTSVCDSLPKMCDMSAVGDKGNTPCIPELVVIDTNNPSLNLEHTVNNVAAYERRFIYVKVTVKDEFKEPGSSRLDTSIEGDYYDKWHFEVYTKSPISVKMSNNKFHLKGGNIHELEKTLKTLFTNHIEHEQKNLAQKTYKGYYDVYPENSENKTEDIETEADDIRQFQLQFRQRMWKFCQSFVPLLISNILSVLSLILCLGEYWILQALPSIRENDMGYSLHTLRFFFMGMFMWYIGMFVPFFLFVVLTLLNIDYSSLSKYALDRVVDRTSERVTRKINACKNRYIYMTKFLLCEKIELVKRNVYGVAAISFMVGAGIYIYKKFFKTGYFTEASNFMSKSPEVEEVVALEEKYHCGSSYKRFNTKNQQIWNTRVVAPSVHKSGSLSLSNTVSSNARLCIITNIKDSRQAKTFCLGIKENLALINLHSLGDLSEGVNISVSATGKLNDHHVYTTVLRECDIVRVKPDIGLVQLSSVQFKDITKHFPKDLVVFKNADGFICKDPVIVHFHSHDMDIIDHHMGKLQIKDVITYKWEQHSRGMCGLPVVAQRDSGSCIVGLHSAGSVGTPHSFAIQILQSEINSACSTLAKQSFVSVASEGGMLYGTAPHFKSPVNYEELGCLMYYGRNNDVSVRQKSKLQRTPFANKLGELFFNTFSHIRTVKYVPPVMSPGVRNGTWVSPYNIAIRKMASYKKPLIRSRVFRTIDVIYKQISKNLDKAKVPKLKPLDIQTAVNGAKEDCFLRRVGMSKAAGFGTPGKKSDYATRYEIDDEIYDEVDDDILAEVAKIIKRYEQGLSNHPVFKAQLKDEPRDSKKVNLGKTRVFYSTPFAQLIVMRMFLSPFFSLMIEHSECFYTAIGIDMHRSADELYRRLAHFSKKFLEGDYGGYDLTMPYEVGQAANHLVIMLLKKLGYNDVQLRIVKGLLGDNMMPIIAMLGDIFLAPGLQLSGKYATAEDNSLRNLIILVYGYITITDRDDFFEKVLPITYGDDVLVAIKDDMIDIFNNITYANFVNNDTSMTFTNSSKSDVFEKFLRPNEISFLKRQFVFHTKLDRYVAPLDLDSLYKTLEWRIPSAELNEVEQIEAMVNSVLRESFFHENGEKFTLFRDKLKEFLYESYSGEYKFDLLTYDQVYRSLCPTAMEVSGGRLPVEELDCVVTEALSCNLPTQNIGHLNSSLDREVFSSQWSTENTNIITTRIVEMSKRLQDLEETLKTLEDPFPGYTARRARTALVYMNFYEIAEMTEAYHACKSEIDSLKTTISLLSTYLHRKDFDSKVYAESGEVFEMEMKEEPHSSIHQNVDDVSGNNVDWTDSGFTSYLNVGQKETLRMQEFLARPIRLADVTVAVGANLTYSADIWSAFLDQPSIRAKLRNYAYIKGTMNVKIAISGSPFHYGKVQVSYQPFAAYNETLKYYDAGGGDRFAKLCYLSQGRGCRVIDVKSNAPLELQFPYLCPQPMLRLFDNFQTVIGENTSFRDSVNLGKLYINSIEPIGCASAGPTNISMFVYMWMTDVELGAPTGTLLQITTESGDERKTGPVEKIASRASEISYALTSVPIIGEGAKASGMVFKGLEHLSALFGFSTPVINTDPTRVKNEPFQNGALTIRADTGKRIVLDPKQELSVDPRMFGSNEDEMSIPFVCARESLFSRFSWRSTDGALSTPVWSVPVTPQLCYTVPDGGNRLFQDSALAFASRPFEFWRGDITFRFEIVCSAYHRGKLAIYFEPNISQAILIDTQLDINKQYLHIVDLQETQDFELCVQWAYPKAWAPCMPPSYTPAMGSLGLNPEDFFRYANGYIAVTPFTELQSPDSSDITVNVYVKSDNMMFNQLIDSHMPNTRPVAESGDIAPITSNCVPLNESSATMDHISEVHFGELPVSFRSLLKRFAPFWDPDGFKLTSKSGAATHWRYDHPIYPIPRPALGTRIGPIAARYVATMTGNHDLFSYLKYAYVGILGSYKHRVSFIGDITFGEMNVVKTRLARPEGEPEFSGGWASDATEISTRLMGTIVSIPHTNAGVEYEVPLYTNNLFGLGFSNEPFPANASVFEGSLTRTVENCFAISKYSDTQGYLIHDAAAGEDFSFFRFQGAPPYVA